MGHALSILMQGRDGGIPADRFADVLTKSLAVLRGVDAQSSEDGKPGIRWKVVKATTNSPLTLLLAAEVDEHRADTSRAVVRSYLRGLRQLESGKGIPSEFGDDTLKEARSLLAVLDRGVSRLEFAAPNEEPVALTLRSAAVIDEFFGGRSASLMADTMIEGSLETVTVHGGEAFDIFDQLTGTRVRCVLPEGKLHEAIAALGKRVGVRGRARFNDKGRPVAIEAESIRILGDSGALPAASDFEGEGRLDITGGMDSVEFVRRLRDA